MSSKVSVRDGVPSCTSDGEEDDEAADVCPFGHMRAENARSSGLITSL
jgi:hypothetical protein